MAIRKNKKRIDPRYFLHETAYRDEIEEGLPKRKPEHADLEEGHTDGFEGKPKKKDRSKDYNEGFKDGRASDKEYKDVTGDKE